MKKIVWVIVVTGFFLLYLFQHRYSVSATQQLAQLEKQRQILKDNITALESKKANTFLLINLEDTAQQMTNQFAPDIQKPESVLIKQVTKTALPDKQQKVKPDTSKTNKISPQISAKINE
jgi:hypothetical protein